MEKMSIFPSVTKNIFVLAPCMELRRSETKKLLINWHKSKKKRTNITILGVLVHPENGRANRDGLKEDKPAVLM